MTEPRGSQAQGQPAHYADLAAKARAAISQLYHGEIATSRTCRTFLGDFPPGPARQCLEFQIADETRHAEAYERYLGGLGGVAAMDRHLAWVFEAASRGPAGPLGTMVAFHVVVEGEVLRVQDSLARLLPCPLLRQINRRVARDEARHVAFGRLYLTEALVDLSAEARGQLYDWLHGLWRRTTERAVSESVSSGTARRLLRAWLRGGWNHHQAALRQIGLGPDADWGRAA